MCAYECASRFPRRYYTGNLAIRVGFKSYPRNQPYPLGYGFRRPRSGADFFAM